jgi:NAD(P)H-dependent FMN reductase
MYDPAKHPAAFRAIDEQYMIDADRWIIVSPEYNGSFPGVLKLFIDAISTHKYGETFADKRALLVGVASGRAGNLRGMEHLTGLLNYLKIHVFPQKLPISSIATALSEDGTPTKDTATAIKGLLDAFYKV